MVINNRRDDCRFRRVVLKTWKDSERSSLSRTRGQCGLGGYTGQPLILTPRVYSANPLVHGVPSDCLQCGCIEVFTSCPYKDGRMERRNARLSGSSHLRLKSS